MKLSVWWVRQGPLLRRQLVSVRVYEREELFLQQLGCHGHHRYAF